MTACRMSDGLWQFSGRGHTGLDMARMASAMTVGLFSTSANCGLDCTRRCTTGLLFIMVRISSGLSAIMRIAAPLISSCTSSDHVGLGPGQDWAATDEGRSGTGAHPANAQSRSTGNYWH